MVRPVRATRRWRAALVVALLALASLPGPAAATGSLIASPSHGQVSQTVTVTYTTDSGVCRTQQVDFSWDGKPLGTGNLDGNCQAAIATKPRPARMG